MIEGHLFPQSVTSGKWGSPLETYQIFLLAIVQGITEFLPISSSAHLILPSQLLGWPDQGQAFDVAVHVGSLGAVMAYFRKDLLQMTKGSLQGVATKRWNSDLSMVWNVVIGVLPAVFFGFVYGGWIETNLRSGYIIACTTIVFGIALFLADRRTSYLYGEKDLNWRHALIIGFAQALALIPGTSRSGITITAALFLGYDRESSARYSFLLSIPIIAGAGLLKTIDLIQSPAAVDWTAIWLGTIVAFVSAYACIHWFLLLLNRIGMTPFVIYRLFLGVILLLVLTN